MVAEQARSGRATGAVTIVNDEGMHLRPATTFAEMSTASGCSVTVRTNRGTADGRSVLELAMLAAPKDTVLNLTVEGDGCEQTLEALIALVVAGFKKPG